MTFLPSFNFSNEIQPSRRREATELQQFVTEIVEHFEQHALLNGYSRSTMRHRRVSVARFLNRFVTGPDLSSLCEKDIGKYLVHLRRQPVKGHNRPKAASTINAELKALKQFSRWAVKAKLINCDITEGFKGLRESDAVKLAPSVEDVRKLMCSAQTRPYVDDEQHARDYLVIVLCADTGLRIGEVIGEADLPGIRVEDVLGREGEVKDQLTVRGKGGVAKVVALTSPVKDAIEEYLAFRRPKLDVNHLVLSYQGVPLTYRAAEKALRQIRTHARVEIQWHDLRRFFATQMWLQGIEGTSLDQLMGHSDSRTRYRYIRDAVIVKSVDDHRKRSVVTRMLRNGGIAV